MTKAKFPPKSIGLVVSFLRQTPKSLSLPQISYLDLPHLVLLGPVLDGVAVVEVGGGAAGSGRGSTPALLLHPGRAVGVELPADGEGGTEGQVGLRLLNSRMLVGLVLMTRESQ